MKMNTAIALMPKTYEELTHQAKRILEAKRMLPDDKKSMSLAEIEAIIQIGQALGLTPWQSMQAIMFIRGQATVWGDFLVGVVWASGKMESIKETHEGSLEDGTYKAICIVKRVGGAEVKRTFSIEDAKKAKLWNKGRIWPQYPKRMLSLRARSWALRDCFGDVTKGLVAVEEAVDYGENSDTGDAQINEIIKETFKEEASTTKTTHNDDLVKDSDNIESIEDKPKDKVDESIPETFITLINDKAKEVDMDPDEAKDAIKSYFDKSKASKKKLIERACNNFDMFWGVVFG